MRHDALFSINQTKNRLLKLSVGATYGFSPLADTASVKANHIILRNLIPSDIGHP